MRKSVLRAAVPAVLVIALVSLLAQPASAHEQRTVGAYKTTVGWATEPVFTGFPNAVQFILSDAAGKPVTDLGADDVKVEVSFGDQKVGPMSMEPAFEVGEYGEPGDYHADLIPSRAGTYAFHFTGKIKGQPIDETYTSGDKTFESPSNPSELEFPAKDPSNAELAESIKALEAKVGDSGSKSGSSNALPLTLAIVALVFSVIAMGKSRKSS